MVGLNILFGCSMDNLLRSLKIRTNFGNAQFRPGKELVINHSTVHDFQARRQPLKTLYLDLNQSNL